MELSEHLHLLDNVGCHLSLTLGRRVLNLVTVNAKINATRMIGE